MKNYELWIMNDKYLRTDSFMTVEEICNGVYISPNYGRNYYENGYFGPVIEEEENSEQQEEDEDIEDIEAEFSQGM